MNGRMTTPIDIVQISNTYDAEGFPTSVESTIASVFAFRQDRNGNEKWMNDASFADVSDTFTIRNPGVDIKPDNFVKCDGYTWDIKFIDKLKGQGMYWTIYGRLVIPSGES